MSEDEAVLRELINHYRRECELLQRHKTIPIDYRYAFFREEVELAKKLILMGKTDVVVVMNTCWQKVRKEYPHLFEYLRRDMSKL